jgi:hypothetical protein
MADVAMLIATLLVMDLENLVLRKPIYTVPSFLQCQLLKLLG